MVTKGVVGAQTFIEFFKRLIHNINVLIFLTDELLWNHLKNNGAGRQIIDIKTQLKRSVLAHTSKFQDFPTLTCNFFQPEITQYAA